MGYSIPTTNFQTTQKTDLPAGLDELIEQSGYSREQILEMVITVQANQIQILQDQIDMLDMIEDEPPRGNGWVGLGLAGLVGYWLGGGFSRDD